MAWRSPSFTTVAVLSLAAGIGAATAVFGAVDAVLLRRLAVTAPDQLVDVVGHAAAARKDIKALPATTYEDLVRAVDFADLIAFRSVPEVDLASADVPTQVVAAELVSSNYFSVLGSRALAGRLPSHGDIGPWVVLSENLWRTRFGSDREMPGRTITVNGTTLTIAGVVRDFRGLVVDRPKDLFVPLAAATNVEARRPPNDPVRVVARLRPAYDARVAAERLSGLFTRLLPASQNWGPVTVVLNPAMRGISDVRSQAAEPLLLLLGLVGVLLIVSCANVSNLLLARFASRDGELAVRLAIGASKGRVLQQLFVETLVISVLGAAAGFVIADVSGPLLADLIPAAKGRPDVSLRFDLQLMMFMSGITVAAALLVLAASAARLRRLEAAGALRRDARVPLSRQGPAQLLIAIQIACSFLLLVGAGSMLRSVSSLWRVDPGFRTDGVLVTVMPSPAVTDTTRYFHQLREAIAAAPGVAHVSLLQFPVMSGAATTGTVDIPGFSPASDDDRWVRVFQVGPDFFDAIGMRLVRGRGIDDRDSASSPRVAVVNESFARFYFGSLEVVGRSVGGGTHIVGVVADARYDSLREPSARALFHAYTQVRARPTMAFVILPGTGAAAALLSASAAVRTFDPSSRIEAITLEDQVARTVWRERFTASLSTGLSLLALVLACAGIYAVVACSVAERRRDIAIRLALGAQSRDIVRVVLRRPAIATALALACGLPGAWVLMRVMTSLLFGIATLDSQTVALSAAVLLAAAAAAALVPVWRLTASDPLKWLRSG